MRAIATPDDIIAIEAAGLAAFQPHAHLLQALEATASAHGGRPAITWLAEADGPAETWTHAALLQRVRQAANLFRALGADDEHGVAFLLPAIPAAWLALLGGEIAGRVCPINYLLDAEHIAALVDAAGARVLVALAPCTELDIAAKAERVRALCPGLRAVLWAGGDDGFEAQLARHSGEHLSFECHAERDSIAATFHTGGTTGAPKLAMHTHGNQLHVARGAALAYALDQRDTVINPFPLFHVAGAFVYGLSTLLAGGNLLLPTLLGMRNPAFVRRYWPVVQEQRVTVLAAVPTVMSALLNVDPGAADLSAVRVLYTGGSPLPDELAAGFERRYGIPVRNILGMTECAGVIGIEPFHAPRVPGSCGLRLPFTEVAAVADAPGPVQPLQAGETGILALRGPNVGPGYTDAARNAGTFEGGWLVTGDIGHVAADGRIFITGRAKDLIIRSGHNIDPGVIEDALLRHPGVLMAAAVGEPDEYAGELPVAFVVPRPGVMLDVAELLHTAAEHVPERPAVPKRITVVDVLPLTAIGKVYKPALRALAIEAAIGERLQRAGLDERVALASEMLARGPALIFTRRNAADDAAITQLMAPFALPWRVQELASRP